MPDPFAPVSPGDDLEVSAVAWNAMLDAGRAHRQPGRPDAQPKSRWPVGCVEVKALNSTGADLAKGSPVRFTAVGGLDLTDDRMGAAWDCGPLYTLGVPTASDFVGVTREPIPSGKYGRVVIGGTVRCNVKINNSGHSYAVPSTNTTALESAATGPIRILHKGTGSTTRMCAVYLGDQIVSTSSGGGVGSITAIVAAGGTSIPLTGANDVYGTVLTVVAPTTGSYLCMYTLTAVMNTTSAGGSIYSRFRVNGTSIANSNVVQCHIDAGGQRVVDTVTNHYSASLTAGQNVEMEVARHISGTVTEAAIVNPPLYHTRLSIIRIS